MKTRPIIKNIFHRAAVMLPGARRIAAALAVMMLTVVQTAWAQNPSWLQSGDAWDATTKTLTLNSNPQTFAYQYCREIEHLVINSGVTTIGVYAFDNCTSLATIAYAEGSQLTTIEGIAFSNCSSLTAIEIPASVTNIGGSAFNNCTKLASVTFAEGTQIETILNVFTGCTSLKAIVIPASVTSIGGSFSGCTNLESVTFAEGSQLTTIMSGTFYGCKSLTDIEILASVTNIDSYAFVGCTNLTTMVVAEGNENYKSQEGLLLTKDGTELLFCLHNRASGDYAIPNGVTTIKGGAFQDCTGLTSITIPASVTIIAGDAFFNCTNLETVTFAEGSQLTFIAAYAFKDCSSLTTFNFAANTPLTNINERAFSGCSALESIALPDGVKIIKEYAFDGCTSLTTIHIPASLTTIEEYAFKGCTSLTTFTVDATSETFASDDGVLVSKDGTSLVCYPLGRTATSYTVPANTTTIDSYTFRDCTALESVTLPAGLKYIGNSAFEGCTGLTSITIPPSTSIGIDVFKDCTNLMTATILSDNSRDIGEMFENVSNSCHFYLRSKIVSDYSTYSSQITIISVVNTTNGATATPSVAPFVSFNGTDYYITGTTFTLGHGDCPIGYVEPFRNYQVKNASGSDITATAVSGTTLTLPESDVTVKACFPLIEYHITCDVGDAYFNSSYYGTTYTIETPTYYWSSNYVTPPRKDYYDFIGWTGPGYDNPSIEIVIPQGSYGDRHYTAVLQPHPYTISYDLDGGMLPADVTNPSSLTIETETFTLNNPKREGYLFDGWTVDIEVSGSTFYWINGRFEGTTVTIPKGSCYNRKYTAHWVYILNDDIGITDANASEVTGQRVLFIRQFHKGKKQTICLPFVEEGILNDGKIWEFTGISGGKAVMTQRTTTSELQANRPYIFESNDDVILGLFGDVNTIILDPKTEDTDAGFTFHGTYTKKHWDADDPLVTGGKIYGFMAEDNDGQTLGQFVKARRATNLRAFSCYLEYDGNLTDTNPSSQARTRGEEELPEVIEIVWRSAGDETGISDASHLMDNGEWIMDNKAGAGWYSLDGRRLSGRPSAKGIYIHEGKKIVIK